MGTIYGYARVSTPRQKLQRQVENIKAAYPNAAVITEKYTGTSVSRPKFDRLLKLVKAGDQIVFDSVSRMSRTAQEGFDLYMDLYNRGISLTFLKEPLIDTEVYRQTAQIAMTGTDADVILEGVNRYLMLLAERQIQIVFDQAQKEVDDLHLRISEGIHQAQLSGKHIGRKKDQVYETRKSTEMKPRIRKMSKDFDGNLKDKEIMEILGLARNTFYKYKKQLISEQYSYSHGGAATEAIHKI